MAPEGPGERESPSLEVGPIIPEQGKFGRIPTQTAEPLPVRPPTLWRAAIDKIRHLSKKEIRLAFLGILIVATAALKIPLDRGHERNHAMFLTELREVCIRSFVDATGAATSDKETIQTCDCFANRVLEFNITSAANVQFNVSEIKPVLEGCRERQGLPSQPFHRFIPCHPEWPSLKI